jgi:hypothetical protein
MAERSIRGPPKRFSLGPPCIANRGCEVGKFGFLEPAQRGGRGRSQLAFEQLVPIPCHQKSVER